MVERDQTMKLNNCERTIFQIFRSKRFNVESMKCRACLSVSNIVLGMSLDF